MRKALLLTVSSMIGIGFMTAPGIAKTSGIILSLLIIMITGACGCYGSFLIARGKFN